MVSGLYSRSCPKIKDSHRRAAWLSACYRPLRAAWRTCTESHAIHRFSRKVFSWSSNSRPSRWPTRLLHPIKVSQTNDSGRAVGRATKGFRQPPFRGRVLMKSETRSPLSFYVTPHTDVRSPVVCLSAPLCWVQAEHEENASQRHSTGRAAGRSG